MNAAIKAALPSWLAALGFRWVLVIAVFAQVAILREVSHGHFMLLSMRDDLTSPFWYLHTLSKATLFGAMAVTFAAIVERRFGGPGMLSEARRPQVILLHLLAFVLLVFQIESLPRGRQLALLDQPLLWRYAATSLTFLAWQATALALVAPRGLVTRMRATSFGFVATGIAAAVVLSSKNNIIIIAIREAIEGSTLSLAMAFYRVIGTVEPALHPETGGPMLSAGTFSVQISPVCAGYQGMLASTLIMAGLVLLEWPSLRRGRALALGIATVCAVFVFNALRIALLLHVGVVFSPEMAVDGFHSYFGTLSLFAVVAVAMVALQHRFFRLAQVGGAVAGPGWALGRQASAPGGFGSEFEEASRYILPLALYLGLLMVAGLFQAGFNWLYPATAMAGLAILFAFRGLILREFSEGVGFSGFAMGIAVYILWVLVVPSDPEGDREFAETLFAAPPMAIAGWVLMRTIGSSVVVPVVEELAFRAGLPILVRGLLGPITGPVPAAVAAFAVSSLAFGILHSDLVAGTLAGACYGLLTLRTGKTGDAIVAHAVTNFLIALTTVGAGRWSLW